MSENNNIKNKWLHVRLNDTEHKQLTDNFSKTTERKLSRYARKILLAEPVTVIHRNGSLDDLIAVLTRLQSDLNGVTNNYNQMVHRLHMADNAREINAWIKGYENEKKNLFAAINEIKVIITQTAKQWLR
ncbi:MAG: plasmid mobilization relaxosome protein MobC [Candidatus Pedobacter colombiensis]|uniref:Plasmid mobilization relaxosome protein MobC n=1 Tax=Candidatus Pedobacter colombiensis TaxID=3121371 RepID=A0AAJ6BAJ3_9SPHI|nr:plasmid mobilization relaxosome protein MobC [Pedobacter sp.]WEK21318.1 MAG: plasmid mobilization relaxosome protein MobC [Pedobacter sp.]